MKSMKFVGWVLVLGLLAAGCNKDESPKSSDKQPSSSGAPAGGSGNPTNSGSGDASKPASTGPSITRAEYNEHPVNLAFDVTGNAKQKYEIQLSSTSEDDIVAWTTVLTIDCASKCEILDSAGERRSNLRFKMTSVNNATTIAYTDLQVEDLGAKTKMRVQISGGASKEFTFNSSLPQVPKH